MNKQFRFILFSVAFIGLFLTSCEKEKEVVQSQKTSVNELDAQKMINKRREKDKARVMRFANKIKALASGSSINERDENLSIEEVAFGAEAVLNIYYTRPDNRFVEVDKSISEVVVSVSNGVVSDADLLVAYLEIGQKMVDHKNTVNYADKKLVYIDITLDDSGSTGDEAILQVKTAYGNKLAGTTLTPPYFNYGWGCGGDVTNGAGVSMVGRDCDPNIMPEWDAAKLFKLTLNTNYRLDHPFPTMPDYGWYSYNVDSEMSYFLVDAFGFPSLNPNDPTPNDNSEDYMFFKIEESKAPNAAAYDAKKCISVDEMNFYYSGLENAIALVESPSYQADPANAIDFPCPNCSWYQYQGYKFFRVEELQATEYGLPGPRTTIHVPEILLQQQFSIYGYPGTGTDGSGTVIDAVLEVHEMLCIDC